MPFRLRLALLLGLLSLANCGPDPTPAPPPESTPATPPPPNVLLIVADDLGWADLDCYGNFLVKSPHLNGLARRGVQFMQAYAAAPTGPPSRAALLTGLPPAGLDTTALAPRLRTLADLAHHHGHRTAHVGRWTLGTPPADLGFDRQAALSAAPPTSYYPPYFPHPPADLDPPPASRIYLTDLVTDRALGILREWQDRPWLLSLNYYAPHVPLEGREDLVKFYRELIGNTHPRRFPRPEYAAMVSAIDENVGRIVDFLTATGQLDNTLIVFTSDNGGLAHRLPGRLGRRTPPTDNGILRGGKGSLYEGGIRVPFLVHYPAYEPDPAATTTPVTALDVYPTLATLFGEKTPDRPGRSLLPVLRGRELPRRTLTWSTTRARAARRERFKRYVDLRTDSTTYFDLRAFPDESRPAAPPEDF